MSAAEHLPVVIPVLVEQILKRPSIPAVILFQEPANTLLLTCVLQQLSAGLLLVVLPVVTVLILVLPITKIATLVLMAANVQNLPIVAVVQEITLYITVAPFVME
jgi:hypothetical protein